MFKRRWNILIDFDGTLHDTESVYAENLDGLLGLDGRKLYHVFLFDIHRKIIHKHYPQRHEDLDLHWKLLLKHLGKPVVNDGKNLLANRFKEAQNAVLVKPRLFHETPLFLDRVFKDGHRLCLSTGGGDSLEKAEALTRVLGKKYFDNILGEEILGCLKHEPIYYKVALETLSWKAEDTLSVGDTLLTDIYPAKLVGIKTIWVNRNNEKAPGEPERRPDHETQNLISVLDALNTHG